MLAVTLSGGLGGVASPQGGSGFLSSISSSLQSTFMPLLGSLLQSYPSIADQVASQVAKQDLGVLMGGAPSSEDCLFLDVYVPGKALKGGKKLPVINWIYGGAFILGSKDGMYDGTPLVKQSDGNVIYVAGNYRVGHNLCW
jgi:acetyl esterase/lipase